MRAGDCDHRQNIKNCGGKDYDDSPKENKLWKQKTMKAEDNENSLEEMKLWNREIAITVFKKERILKMKDCDRSQIGTTFGNERLWWQLKIEQIVVIRGCDHGPEKITL